MCSRSRLPGAAYACVRPRASRAPATAASSADGRASPAGLRLRGSGRRLGSRTGSRTSASDSNQNTAHAPLACPLTRREPHVGAVSSDRSSRVESGRRPVAGDVEPRPQRDQRRVNCDRAGARVRPRGRRAVDAVGRHQDGELHPHASTPSSAGGAVEESTTRCTRLPFAAGRSSRRESGQPAGEILSLSLGRTAEPPAVGGRRPEDDPVSLGAACRHLALLSQMYVHV